MARILVSGLLNTETTARVRGFPISYYPIDYPFFGVGTDVSGVALNLSKALKTLGDEVRLTSLIGTDPAARLVLEELERIGLSREGVLPALRETPASVVLFEEGGRRQIYCDLKDIQESAYPFTAQMLDGCEAVAACNINFNRPLLRLARERQLLIASDVHVLSDPDDAYNRDFLAAADLLFLSDEGIEGDKAGFLRALGERYHNRVLVLGMGASGALLHLPAEGVMLERPAWRIGGAVNTVGAGDALFSAFLHYTLKGLPPARALDLAQLFAALKIRHSGAARGFPDEGELADALLRYSQ
ncbi:MAG: carbohydrate kinase family protein [Oscillospiraceae bacterium]|nr:carbohydrate kinase family protein [Oscillospiraceae bacterium]